MNKERNLVPTVLREEAQESEGVKWGSSNTTTFLLAPICGCKACVTLTIALVPLLSLVHGQSSTLLVVTYTKN